jgi:para-nitrobenzyl esterase
LFRRAAAGRESVGAIHAAETWYVFGALAFDTAPSGPKLRYDDDDLAISAAIQEYWTNFAKNSDPNSEKLEPWPRFDGSKRAIWNSQIAGRRAEKGSADRSATSTSKTHSVC